MTSEPPLTILLVEDDPTDVRLLRELLNHADVCPFTMQAVATVADAERRLVNEEYDCVLLDLSLPDSDGLPSVERVLDVARVPVIVLTGRADYELGLASIEAGAQDFLVKGEVKGNTILRCAQWARSRAARLPSGPIADRWGLLDRSGVPAAVLDPELKVAAANPAFEQLTGRSEAELAQLSITELIDLADIVDLVLDLRSTLRGEAPARTAAVQLRHTNGQVWDVHMHFAGVAASETEPSRLLCFVTEGG